MKVVVKKIEFETRTIKELGGTMELLPIAAIIEADVQYFCPEKLPSAEYTCVLRLEATGAFLKMLMDALKPIREKIVADLVAEVQKSERL